MARRGNAHQFAALMLVPTLLLGSVGIFAQSGFDDGVTPLMRAVRDAEGGAFNHALKNKRDINAQDAYGWTALTYAAVRGDKPTTKKLLSKGADPNIVDENKRSILMHAVDYGREEIVRLLIKYKADLDHRDNKGATAIGLAWAKAKDTIAARLEKAGAAPLRTENRRADIYSSLPPYNGPFLLNPPPRGSLPPTVYSDGSELKMRVLVGADGTVRKVRVLIGLPNGGTSVAVSNAFASRYQPATQNGQPIEVWTDGGFTIRKVTPLQGPFRR